MAVPIHITSISLAWLLVDLFWPKPSLRHALLLTSQTYHLRQHSHGHLWEDFQNLVAFLFTPSIIFDRLQSTPTVPYSRSLISEGITTRVTVPTVTSQPWVIPPEQSPPPRSAHFRRRSLSKAALPSCPRPR